MCYIMAWIFGGIDLQINAVFFEHSPLGEEGIQEFILKFTFDERKG